jgi:hypothetical protein
MFAPVQAVTTFDDTVQFKLTLVPGIFLTCFVMPFEDEWRSEIMLSLVLRRVTSTTTASVGPTLEQREVRSQED